MEMKSQLKIPPIEEFALECIRRRNYGEFRRLLIEGVDANACDGEFLLSAARCGSARMIRLLVAYGAVMPDRLAVRLLGLSAAAAAPDALAVVMHYLTPRALQAALRRSNHAVIIIAGDVRAKARRYHKAKLRLKRSEIMTRRDDLLGDALRLAVTELAESRENLWPGIVKRSEECAQLLLDVFMPLTKSDSRAVAQWLTNNAG
jgi:hypothetical protein